jgi:hypothetical protein
MSNLKSTFGSRQSKCFSFEDFEQVYLKSWVEVIWHEHLFQGDSGGPLVHFRPQPIQIGILAYGNKYCNYNSSNPDVYISVGHFRDWIDSIVARAWLRNIYLHRAFQRQNGWHWISKWREQISSKIYLLVSPYVMGIWIKIICSLFKNHVKVTSKIL